MDAHNSEVVDVPEEMHYALRVDGRHSGLAAYTIDGSTITFTHTETDPERQGQGLGGALVQGALDDARSRGLDVLPQCPFVAHWITEHPAYADLVQP